MTRQHQAVVRAVTEYPGLDASFTSIAWTAARTLVVHQKGNLCRTACESPELILQYLLAALAALPNAPFVQHGSSYLSLLSGSALRLSSNLHSASHADEPLAAASRMSPWPLASACSCWRRTRP
jgi:hypothetical protein